MRVCKKMVVYLGIKRKYTWQKTHVYRVAGMIASIRGKKPHVYRVIILKQIADHTSAWEATTTIANCDTSGRINYITQVRK